MSACTKYGLNNPMACVSRRLAPYGNTEDVMKELGKLAAEHPQAGIQPKSYGSVNEARIATPEVISRIDR